MRSNAARSPSDVSAIRFERSSCWASVLLLGSEETGLPFGFQAVCDAMPRLPPRMVRASRIPAPVRNKLACDEIDAACDAASPPVTGHSARSASHGKHLRTGDVG